MFFFGQIVSKPQGGAYAMQTPYVSQIPIPVYNKKNIEFLVAQILTIKRAYPTANVSALEWEIDQLVYALYGLTAEEIAIVENQTKK